MKSRQLLVAAWSLFLTPLLPPQAWSAETVSESALPAAAQDAEATFQRARAHLNGFGAAKDPAKAFNLMQKAAGQGHAEAIGGVGYFYANAVVVPKDEAKAVEWFRKGAEKGGPRTQYNLGRMLLDGKGIARDEKAGLEWMRKAAEQGVMEASATLGSAYYSGKFGAQKDYAKAYPFLLKAAEQGHADSQNAVGLMLCDGLGVERDLEQGKGWFRKAAVEGHTLAQSNLGMRLGASSRLADQDPRQRIEGLAWLMAAEAQGEVVAVKVLGDTLQTADANEVAEARKKAVEIRNNVNSKIGERKLFQAMGKTYPPPAPAVPSK